MQNVSPPIVIDRKSRRSRAVTDRVYEWQEKGESDKESAGFPSSTGFRLNRNWLQENSTSHSRFSLPIFRFSLSSCFWNVGGFFCIFLFSFFFWINIVYIYILCFLIDWKWFFRSFFGERISALRKCYTFAVGLDEMEFRI